MTSQEIFIYISLSQSHSTGSITSGDRKALWHLRASLELQFLLFWKLLFKWDEAFFTMIWKNYWSLACFTAPLKTQATLPFLSTLAPCEHSSSVLRKHRDPCTEYSGLIKVSEVALISLQPAGYMTKSELPFIFMPLVYYPSSQLKISLIN